TALVGFSRLLPGGLDLDRGQRLLWKRQASPGHRWLPAVQVRGEGVFIRFDETALERWENSQAVLKRVGPLVKQAAASRFTSTRAEKVNARYVFIHTFSH